MSRSIHEFFGGLISWNYNFFVGIVRVRLKRSSVAVSYWTAGKSHTLRINMNERSLSRFCLLVCEWMWDKPFHITPFVTSKI